VKPGSILDVKYVSTQIFDAFYFQSNIPTHSRLGRPTILEVKYQECEVHVKQPFIKNIGKTDDMKETNRAMVNVILIPGPL